VLDTMEAGLVLTGTEVKSLRRRGASIKEAFARVSRGEIWVESLNITPYEQGNRYNHDPIRARKLLLHRREIEKLVGAVERDGLALIPLELYFLRGRAKLLLALAKGKKAHDKREDLKRREADREVARAMAWRGRK
jgi:SsrA-binding protein